MAKLRLVQVTQLQINPNLDTALTVLDSSLTTLMNGILAAPPTGFQEGSMKFGGQVVIVWDGTNFNVVQSVFYQVLS